MDYTLIKEVQENLVSRCSCFSSNTALCYGMHMTIIHFGYIMTNMQEGNYRTTANN